VPALGARLEAKAEAFRSKAPTDKQKLYASGIEQVRSSGVEKSARNVGDRAPDFTLPDAAGKPVHLADLLRRGPVVLTWYRGGWCPYCNLTLSAMQESVPAIEQQGATLVAVSPELPGKAAATVKNGGLKFTVLSDRGNQVARAYGIAYTLPAEIAASYRGFFKIEEYNGDRSNVLPLAATYVIDSRGVIRWAFVEADYKKRAEPADILAALKKLK